MKTANESWRLKCTGREAEMASSQISMKEQRLEGEKDEDGGFGKWVNGHSLAIWHSRWEEKKKKIFIQKETKLFKSVIIFVHGGLRNSCFTLIPLKSSRAEDCKQTICAGLNALHMTTPRGNNHLSDSEFLPADVLNQHTVTP